MWLCHVLLSFMAKKKIVLVVWSPFFGGELIIFMHNRYLCDFASSHLFSSDIPLLIGMMLPDKRTSSIHPPTRRQEIVWNKLLILIRHIEKPHMDKIRFSLSLWTWEDKSLYISWEVAVAWSGSKSRNMQKSWPLLGVQNGSDTDRTLDKETTYRKLNFWHIYLSLWSNQTFKLFQLFFVIFNDWFSFMTIAVLMAFFPPKQL